MQNQIFYLALLLIGGSLAIQARQSHGGESVLQRTVMSEISSDMKPIDRPLWLRAGPIRVKFEDGELRYFYVGDKEIVRRIYFGVRSANWDTAMPKFSTQSGVIASDHFTITLSADCKKDSIDYSWTGTITGTADGKITFTVTGTPNADFDSNRIGLCVLFGVGSLADQAFETDGKIATGQFPSLVAPGLVASQFHKLHYSTPIGLDVTCNLEGTIFDMEDQRNWGDSSWKAYAPLPYAYKHVGKGDVKTETVTIRVAGTANAKASPQDPVHVKIGPTIEGTAVPKLVAPPTEKVHEFTAISFNHDKFKDAKQLAWSYIPTTHLPDEDVIMENMSTVAYQAKTVKSFNPDCTLQIGPIGLSDAGSRDPRANTPLAAAWAVGMVKYLATGGVSEAGFAVGDGAPAAALDAVRPYVDKKLLSVETDPADAHHLVAFAAENEQGVGLFLVNRTADACHAEVDGLTAKRVYVLHIGASEQPADVTDGTLKIDLAPHDVVRIEVARAARP